MQSGRTLAAALPWRPDPSFAHLGPLCVCSLPRIARIPPLPSPPSRPLDARTVRAYAQRPTSSAPAPGTRSPPQSVSLSSRSVGRSLPSSLAHPPTHSPTRLSSLPAPSAPLSLQLPCPCLVPLPSLGPFPYHTLSSGSLPFCCPSPSTLLYHRHASCILHPASASCPLRPLHCTLTRTLTLCVDASQQPPEVHHPPPTTLLPRPSSHLPLHRPSST